MTVFILLSAMDYEYTHVAGVYASRDAALAAARVEASERVTAWDYEPEALEESRDGYRVGDCSWTVREHKVI